MPERARPARWLLLVHQLPPRPSNLRVQIWRRLRALGAVVLRNSVYVLPNSSETAEDFDWVRTEIAGRGGQVSVLEANVVDGYTDNELVDQFRRLRDEDYTEVVREAQSTLKRWQKRRSRPARPVLQREFRKLRERLTRIRTIDHFEAPGRMEAEASIAALEQFLTPAPPSTVITEGLKPDDFRGRMWITRPRPGIDRMASAWFIRRFIASDAGFTFGSIHDASGDGHVPFDMTDVEFGHHGEECTMETLVRRFDVRDDAVRQIARLVHDLDLKESRYGVPESVAIGRLVEGLREVVSDDHELLERGILMIEALYRSFAKEAGKPHEAVAARSGRAVKPRRDARRGG